MRFKASIQNISTFTKFAASLASLGPIAWVRLNEHEARFTIIPEQGTQVWAVLAIDTIFNPHEYTIQSATDNVINLEVPLQPLHRALQSARAATSASIRLTKRDGRAVLSLTITTAPLSSGTPASHGAFGAASHTPLAADATSGGPDNDHAAAASSSSFDMDAAGGSAERETVITQEVPVRVLGPASVAGIHEPRCREPDVHIWLPPLAQLKAVSDRFTRLAGASRDAAGLDTASGFGGGGGGGGGRGRGAGGGGAQTRLEMAANMHGMLRMSFRTDALAIASVWDRLENPELDPSHVEGGEDGVARHPSTRMRELGGADGMAEEGWAKVRIDGRDWGKVMSVGRLGGRVIACFCHEHALILYAYLPNEDEGRAESVLTYYVSSYSS